MVVTRTLDVFVSSTCYDLLDLRAELGRFLTDQGLYVRLSEDPTSTFAVEPTGDSIESCLANVEAADVVVCVIDRRYAGVLTNGPYAGKSATHAEVEHARSLSKPVFFFVRDKAIADYAFMRDNGVESRTRWIEPDDPDHRKKWFGFVATVSKLPKHEKWSNWYDPFKDVVELKQLALKRLVDRFPRKTSFLALAPDRLVRITCVQQRGGAEHATVHGYFENVGVGPAMNLVYGWSIASRHDGEEEHRRGGLLEGGRVQDLAFSAQRAQLIVFCEYQNRFGGKYRIEQAFRRVSSNSALEPKGDECLFIGTGENAGQVQWTQTR